LPAAPRGMRDTRQRTHGEARQVRQHVRSLAAGAREAEQDDPRHERRPPVGPSIPRIATETPGVGRQQAKGREHGGRSTGRRVRLRLQEGVQQVCGACREQHRGPGDARAQQLARQQAEHRAEAQVGQQVADVEVQRERRDRAPPLARSRRPGAQRARVEPVSAEREFAREIADDQDHGRVDDRPEPGGAMQRLRRGRPLPGWIFALVVLEMRDRGRLVAGLHQQRPRAPEPHDLRFDPHRVQHEAALLAGGAPERAKDLDGLLERHDGLRSRRSVSPVSSARNRAVLTPWRRRAASRAWSGSSMPSSVSWKQP